MVDMRFKQIGIVLALIFIMSAGAMAQMCDFCSKEIMGRYFTFHQKDGDVVVCEACRNKTGQCSLCSIPIRGTNPRAADLLCAECRRNAKFCAVCNDAIRGEYFISPSGKNICSKCEKISKKCDSCRTALIPGEWTHDHGYTLCSRCRQELKRCRGCEDPILGPYMSYKGFDGFFCRTCSEKTPACVSCSRPTGQKGFQLDNGKMICADCRPTAVIRPQQLKRLSREVQNHLDRHMLMIIENDIRWFLEDDLPGDADDNLRESGRFIQVNDDFTIKILKGLSRDLCIEIIAHELAHAWQAENFPNLKDKLHQEGFAQWVAAKVVEDYRFDRLLERFDARDDVYGDGYRLMMRLEKQYGVEGMFKYLRKQGSL